MLGPTCTQFLFHSDYLNNMVQPCLHLSSMSSFVPNFCRNSISAVSLPWFSATQPSRAETTVHLTASHSTTRKISRLHKPYHADRLTCETNSDSQCYMPCVCAPIPVWKTCTLHNTCYLFESTICTVSRKGWSQYSRCTDMWWSPAWLSSKWPSSLCLISCLLPMDLWKSIWCGVQEWIRSLKYPVSIGLSMFVGCSFNVYRKCGKHVESKPEYVWVWGLLTGRKLKAHPWRSSLFLAYVLKHLFVSPYSLLIFLICLNYKNRP